MKLFPTLNYLTLDLVNNLAELEPFGTDNAQPVFGLYNLTLTNVAAIGDGKHLKIEAAKKGNVDLRTIDILLPHQEHLRIIEAAAKRLRIPMEKVYLNIHKYGNTSAASIGLAIGDALEEGRLKKGDLIALTGFGAGLTYGSLIMRWSK